MGKKLRYFEETLKEVWQGVRDDGELLAEDKKYSFRRELCQGCPKFSKHILVCRECSCYMPMKARLERARCPIGKW